MKAHNHIDEIFQQHFAEAASPMNNQEALWQRISGKMGDKNRGFLWLISVGFVFCVVAGFGLINLNNFTDQESSNKILSNTLINNQPSQGESNQLILTESEEKENENEKSIKSAKDETIKALKEDPKLIFRNSEIIKNSESGVINNNNQLTELSKANKTEVLNSTASSISEGGEGVERSEESKNIHSSISDLKFIDLGTQDISLFDNTPFKFNQSDSWSRCEVKTPGHFFVDVYGQAGLPMDKIDFSQVGSDQTAYRDFWDARFDPKASWHGGAQIGYEFQNGLKVSAGAEYQELVTQYSDNQRITETIRVWDPQAYFTIDMNGDRVWVGDTVTAINIYDRKFVRKNTHTLLHIPFQVSYDILKKPSFHIAVDASAALNLSKTYEGQYIRSDQTLIMIDDNNPDNYTSKDIGVSFSAGLHLGYYLNDNWEVYASPRFRYNPNSYLVDTETLKITRNMIGLRGGVRYHF